VSAHAHAEAHAGLRKHTGLPVEHVEVALEREPVAQ
jgi:hypothetical protein